MGKTTLSETELYPPVKRLLEGQGYEVKAEIGAADVVGVRGDELVVVELKTGFSLSLFHQALERQAVSEHVYLCVPRVQAAVSRRALKNNLALCRRLGLGLITVRLSDQFVEVHADPVPYRPRPSKAKRGRLLREFARRVGDPNEGGATRVRLVTAYRQDALRGLAVLLSEGPTKASDVARLSGVETARRLMADDHYGWFERVETGIYAVTPKGVAAAESYRAELDALEL
ncbi:MAG: DUF2161 family putative PD-(D/E)XK-type phosphodiesterase [Pseudomonadota bacterium]